MKRYRRAGLVLGLVLVLVLAAGCGKSTDNQAANAMTLQPKVLTEKEMDLYYSLSSAELYAFKFNVDDTVKTVKLQALVLDENGVWQVLQEREHEIDRENMTFALEFYPDLATLSSVVGVQPSIRVSGLNMTQPESKYYDLRTGETAIQKGIATPLLMIFGQGDGAVMPKSTTPEGWGDSSTLMADQARYAITVTFNE